MKSPFGFILDKLDSIEKAIEKLNAGGPLAQVSDPMDIRDLAKYLKISVSAIYKFTSSDTIPHYKNGKRLYFKREEINEWMFSNKIKTMNYIAKEANEYIRKNPRR